jgi:hypothetical protein
VAQLLARLLDGGDAQLAAVGVVPRQVEHPHAVLARRRELEVRV